MYSLLFFSGQKTAFLGQSFFIKTGTTVTGWWYTNPSEKYEFVNGKDDPTISHILLNIKNV
jgi:hypothetical protein